MYPWGTDMRTVDGIRCTQTAVAMRDGVRLNTFVYLPAEGGPAYPVILQRTPYGITCAGTRDPRDCTRGWLPSPEAPMRGSILRGYRNLVARGYAAIYQDTRGRYGSEGEDRVYADDAADGYDTLEWIANQPWCSPQFHRQLSRRRKEARDEDVLVPVKSRSSSVST